MGFLTSETKENKDLRKRRKLEARNEARYEAFCEGLHSIQAKFSVPNPEIQTIVSTWGTTEDERYQEAQIDVAWRNKVWWIEYAWHWLRGHLQDITLKREYIAYCDCKKYSPDSLSSGSSYLAAKEQSFSKLSQEQLLLWPTRLRKLVGVLRKIITNILTLMPSSTLVSEVSSAPSSRQIHEHQAAVQYPAGEKALIPVAIPQVVAVDAKAESVADSRISHVEHAADERSGADSVALVLHGQAEEKRIIKSQHNSEMETPARKEISAEEQHFYHELFSDEEFLRDMLDRWEIEIIEEDRPPTFVEQLIAESPKYPKETGAQQWEKLKQKLKLSDTAIYSNPAFAFMEIISQEEKEREQRKNFNRHKFSNEYLNQLIVFCGLVKVKPEEATRRKLTKAFRLLMLEVHPDKTKRTDKNSDGIPFRYTVQDFNTMQAERNECFQELKVLKWEDLTLDSEEILAGLRRIPENDSLYLVDVPFLTQFGQRWRFRTLEFLRFAETQRKLEYSAGTTLLTILREGKFGNYDDGIVDFGDSFKAAVKEANEQFFKRINGHWQEYKAQSERRRKNVDSTRATIQGLAKDITKLLAQEQPREQPQEQKVEAQAQTPKPAHTSAPDLLEPLLPGTAEELQVVFHDENEPDAQADQPGARLR